VTGGTRVLSDWLVVRVTVNQGESFLDADDRHGRERRSQKTPNEIALTILLVKMTLIFMSRRSRSFVLDLRGGYHQTGEPGDDHGPGCAAVLLIRPP